MPKRSQQEILDALRVQRKAIEVSCASYDQGNWWEAFRLATAVYVVVHDYGRTVSLLTQLEAKESLSFVASGRPVDARNLIRETPLVKVRVTNTENGAIAQFLPRLGDGSHPYRFLAFSKWWNDDPIFRDGRFALTRKRLTFTLRNKEGGAHFDANLDDADYERFARESPTTPYLAAEGSNSESVLGAELATMRQIAWELATTLDRAKIG